MLYGAYMDYQLRALLERGGGLGDLPLERAFSVRSSSRGKGPARIENWLFKSDRLRRARFSYFDAGDSFQAFNSLLYPDLSFNLPMLGIDLLALGSNRILCVIDVQPISPDPSHMERHAQELKPIYSRFADMCSRMSDRHFDQNQYFSPYMIFYRSERGHSDPNLQVPGGRLFAAMRAYVDVYLRILSEAVADESPASRGRVLAGQNSYDQYNSERDPAIKLFNTYFGEEWSARFTEEFLFPGATVPAPHQ